MTIRRRLVLMSVAAFVTVLVVSGMVALGLLRSRLINDVDTSLNERRAALEQLLQLVPIDQLGGFTADRPQLSGTDLAVIGLAPDGSVIGAAPSGAPDDPDPLKPADALELVGLTDRMDHFPAQLSGGEQQRVAIARAVAKQPEILLCDEPTGALDFKTGIRVLEVLHEVNRSLRTTTAVITHHAPIASMADRVVSLADGMVASDRTNETKVSPAELSW